MFFKTAVTRGVLGLTFALGLALQAAPAAAQSSTINQAIEDYNAGKFAESAFRFYDVYENDSDPANRQKAEYYLARSLYLMEEALYQPAMYFYSEILKAGPRHPYYLKAIEGLVDTKDKLRDAFVVPNLLDKYYGGEFSGVAPEVLHRINVIVGQKSFEKRKYKEAKDFFGAVPRESTIYAEAQYRLGINEIAQQQYEEAAARFESILKLDGKTQRNWDELRDLSNMALGRVHYTLGDNEKAIDHFRRIRRFSEHWYESLFEIAWAHFMNGDFGKALGDLHSVQSPYFGERYIPETFILKATIYFQNCLFAESSEAVNAFLTRYVPQREAVQASLAAYNPEVNSAYYFLVGGPNAAGRRGPANLAAVASQVPPIPEEVAAHLRRNPVFEAYDFAIGELLREQGAAEKVEMWRGSRLLDTLKTVIEQNYSVLLQVAGRWAYDRLNQDIVKMDPGGLISLEGSARLIQFEVSKAEKNLLESGANLAQRLAGKAGTPRTPSQQFQYWSWDGEYWVDELGFYQYTVVGACEAPKTEGANK